jgi:4,5-dihydroxyphthalate decarboxylase
LSTSSGGAVRLSLACWDYDRTRALQSGRVRPSGIDLIPLVLPVEETFHRMLAHAEFDVAELSLSSYVLGFSRDDPRFIAIPVFPSRVFRHGSIYVRTGGDVQRPEDLRDRVVGVPEYQMTASVWIRGMLADRHGVPADSVRYRTGGLHDAGRTEKIPLELPASFDVTPIPPDRTLNDLLVAGDIDALYTARAPRAFAEGTVRRLFDDPRSAERDYFRDTGIFPIMHTVVIRRDVYEANRWVARSLLDAFTASKDLVYPELHEITALKSMLPWGVNEAEDTVALMGPDFWAYGIEANRALLETFLRYSHEQGLARRPLTVEEIFAPETGGRLLI